MLIFWYKHVRDDKAKSFFHQSLYKAPKKKNNPQTTCLLQSREEELGIPHLPLFHK